MHVPRHGKVPTVTLIFTKNAKIENTSTKCYEPNVGFAEANGLSTAVVWQSLKRYCVYYFCQANNETSSICCAGAKEKQKTNGSMEQTHAWEANIS